MSIEKRPSHELEAYESPPESVNAENTIQQGNEAVLLRVDTEKGVPLKLARDGHTVLIPQPSEDPKDPLNWSWGKKHIILFILALSAFCGDFSSGAGIPCIVLQGEEWGMSPNVVNYSGNLNVLMIALGGLFWIPPIYFWGRLPVLFWTTLMGTFFTLGCTLTTNYDAFYALRALQGFCLTAGQTIGLSFIKDMFYFHEHARKIGLWAWLFLLSPYFGPCLGNFILAGTGDWRNVFWMVFGVVTFDLALVIVFADESWYRRDIPMHEQPDRGSRFARLIGIWQIKHHKNYYTSFAAAYYRVFAVFIKPVVLPTLFYYALSFMWSVGINITSALLLETPRAAGGYGFDNNAVGYIYFTPVVAISLGEIFGHYFNDFLANRYVKKHAGIFKPEGRLPACYLGAFFMIPGLVLVGQSLQKHLPWVGIMFGWGIFVFGVMVASVAVTAYLLDCYPNGSGEVGGFINLARTLSGFTVGYYQQPWGLKLGFDVSFGIQAALVAAGTIILTFMYLYGENLRAKGGPLRFKGSS